MNNPAPQPKRWTKVRPIVSSIEPNQKLDALDQSAKILVNETIFIDGYTYQTGVVQNVTPVVAQNNPQ